MSVTIHYRNTSKTDPHLKRANAPSSLIDGLNRAFSAFPCELDESSIPTLRGMSAISGEPAYAEIIELIEKLGSIELYARY